MSHDSTFDTRLRRLGRRHSKMYRNGIVHKVGPDGLISAYPRRRLPRFPLRGLVILFFAALTFKGVLLASLGSGVYQQRVDLLAGGSFVEKAGAWVMQIDPATEFVARTVAPLLPTR